MSAYRITILAVLLAARPAFAQTTGSLTVAGGSSTDARGVRSNAVIVGPSVRVVSGTYSTVSLGATGTAFQSGGWVLGANGSFATREPLGPRAALTLSAAGGANRTSYDVTLARADVVPAIELTVSGLTLFGGARGAIGSTTLPPAIGRGPFPIFTPSATVTRTSVAPVYGGQLRIAGASPMTSVTLWAREEPMRIERVSVTDRSAGASIRLGTAVLSGTVGQRRAADERADFASAAASFALSQALAFEVAGGTYPSDRFTAASGGRFLSAGLQFRFGRAVASAVLPRPSGVPPVRDGFTRFSLRSREASRVELMGDWNGWKPVATERAANGVWYVDVRLNPGEYRYAFRVNGSEWRVPEGASAVDDGFGAKSAYIVVRSSGSAK